MTVRIPISADPSQIVGAFNQIKEALGRAKQEGVAFASLNLGHPELSDVSDGLRTIEQNFQELKRVGRGRTAAGIRAGGYRDSLEFMERGGREYADPNERAAFIRNTGAYITQNTQFAPRPSIGGGSALGEAEAAGEGGAMGSAASKGMGMLGKLGMIGLGIAGVGGIIGSVTKGVRSAEQEAQGVDTLTRQVNLASSGFTQFRDGLRQAGKGLMVSYNEMVGYASAFTAAAGRANAASVTSGTETAVGLARSFGMDPGQTASMMGQFQFLGAMGSTESQQKKFAMLIAEAISSGGMYGKGSQVMQAMLQFVSASERTMTNTPDVAAYSSLLASMYSSGMPGLRANAPQILQSIDSSIKSGGGVGAASQNFMWRALNHGRANMGVMGTTFLEQQGIVGSEASEYAFLKKIGAPTDGLNAKDTRTNFQMIMEGLSRQFPGRKNMLWRAEAASNMLGISKDQALTLETMKPAALNGMGALVAKAGIDPSQVNVSGLEEIGRISGAGSNMGKLDAIRADFLKTMGLSGAERAKLEGAKGPAALSEELTRVAAAHGRTQTQGSQTVQSIKNLENALTKVGSTLLNPINMIRNDVAKLAGDSASLTGDIVKSIGGDKGAQKRLGGFAQAIALHPHGWQQELLGSPFLELRSLRETFKLLGTHPPNMGDGGMAALLQGPIGQQLHITHTHVHTDRSGRPLQHPPKTTSEVTTPHPAGA